MELSFVISALRRRFWVVTLLALLGSLPGLLADPPTSSVFESISVLEVRPPTRATVNYFNTDPDRYVTSQMAVLTSDSLASDVAQRASAELGENLGLVEVKRLVEIEQVPETDIVEITTKAGSAEAARVVSQAFADLYVQGLATTDEDQVQLVDLDRQIDTLENRLAMLDDRLREAMAPYLPRRNDATPDPIPPAENVDPYAVSQRQLVQSELSQLRSARNDLELQSRVRVNSAVISNAPLPLQANPPGGNLLLAGGLLAGVVLGVVVALMWGRFSAKVLDEMTAGEIIGAPVVSEISHYRSLARSPISAFQSLPRSAVPTIDQLCVRAEALAPIDAPLTVVVTGTMRSAGSTTLALAMAERFAAGGASVVLVDADVRDPRVTALFNATGDGGVPAVIASRAGTPGPLSHSIFTRTMDPAVSVLGLGPNRGSAALRRDTVFAVLEAARSKAGIVVVDGGPVLDLASTIQFAAFADAVVLAVPLARQKADSLTDMARQLESVRGKLLPVVTSPSRRQVKGDVVRADGAIAMPGAAPVRRPAPTDQIRAVPPGVGGVGSSPPAHNVPSTHPGGQAPVGAPSQAGRTAQPNVGTPLATDASLSPRGQPVQTATHGALPGSLLGSAAEEPR